MRSPTRRALARSAAAAIVVRHGSLVPAYSSVELPTVVPMSLCGGGYCALYKIDGQRFRAVLDTGSPFLVVDGTCAATMCPRWNSNHELAA